MALFGLRKPRTPIVRTLGDPALKKKAAPALEINHETHLLGADLIRAMKIYDGVGIAAPQVGVPLRIFAVNAPPPRLRPDDDGPPRPLSQGEAALLPMMPLVFINPEIISGSDTLVSYEEGCLSVPDIYADVMRPETIVFQAQILGGAFISLEVGGFLARILQHETDHLNGIVFVDRLEPGKLDGIRSKLDKLKKSGKKKGFLRILEDQS